MNVLGVTYLGSSNGAAALIKDGELVAFSEEERHIRKKHASSKWCNYFPKNAIYYCLEKGGVSPHEIDEIGIGFSHLSQTLNFYQNDEFVKAMLRKKATAFPTSQASDRTSGKRLTFNGNQVFLGDDEKWLEECFKTLGAWAINDNLMYKYLDEYLPGTDIYPKVKWYSHHDCHAASSIVPSNFKETNFMSFDGEGGHNAGVLGFFDGETAKIFDTIHPYNSLGAFYSSVTETLGFTRHSGEGKTMGLASYGKVDITSLPKFTTSNNKLNLPRVSGPIYNAWRDEKWEETESCRENPLSDEATTLAATAQHYFEEFIIEHARKLHSMTDSKNFALAGGSFLNCTGNGKLLEQDFVDQIFVQPASHDSGSALGAAILCYKEKMKTYPKVDFTTAYWGSEFSEPEVEKCLIENGVEYSCIDPAYRLADLLHQDLVVGYFAGRAEVGPRALCHRSILANPTKKENLDRVNNIKGREFWRPLAPTIAEEYFHEIVNAKQLSPFMLIAAQVKEAWKEKIPAVVHVDGSCRPQSINAQQNPVIHNALLNFKKFSGAPVFLNTSFNLNGEPLVDSPMDALNTFLNSDLDALIMENFLIKKQ